MREQIPFVPDSAADRAVLAYLAGTSAHSDIAIPLCDAAQDLPGADIFCPDPHAFRYVLAHCAGRIFCFAEGMHAIGVRLSPDAREKACAEGAEPIPSLGPDWYSLRLFDGPCLLLRCAHWIAAAHASVASDGTDKP